MTDPICPCGTLITRRPKDSYAQHAARKFCSRDCQVAGRTRTPLSARLWARVDKSQECWVWTGAATKNGYGVIALGGAGAGNILTHVAAHLEMVGAIPEGWQVDHLCRNTLCCRPDHLEAVTQLENLRRQAAAKTHCKRGHEFTPENTYRPPAAPSKRHCRTCTRLRGAS